MKSNAEFPTVHAEGELYKVIDLRGRAFRILYGYYEERERLAPSIEPMPIYPDFRSAPQYTEDGCPFVTMMQDICEVYKGSSGPFRDCSSCEYFEHGEDLIGICTNAERRVPQGGIYEEKKIV